MVCNRCVILFHAEILHYKVFIILKEHRALYVYCMYIIYVEMLICVVNKKMNFNTNIIFTIYYFF